MLIHHGVRGSIPSSNFETTKYGGNTPCIEIITDKIQIIFDCGSGFSKVKFAEKIPTIIFLSHFHHDHIQGLPFNEFNVKNSKPIFLTNGVYKNNILKDILSKYLSPPYFPIDFIKENNVIKFIDFDEIASMYKEFNFDKIILNHPGKASGYSMSIENKKFCYLLDNEFDASQERELIQFCKDSHSIIWDGMYTEIELEEKKGWGHSSIEQGINFGQKANSKNLIISHHSPSRSDEQLDRIKFKYSGTNLLIASENERMKING